MKLNETVQISNLQERSNDLVRKQEVDTRRGYSNVGSFARERLF